ncbi:hypothetical protein TASIC1_0013020900 [Trichoderma asperellum]|uniref:Uncharacterized protein n=1 Tax=Trichoderma asperellum TaxID=101201 RepID=A0A6V8RA86_TRIAP|nr:hypothetical protein TASIC1_0013020900 [Trichoderma asperellum]
MWCFRITAFAAVMFGEKVLCRAVHGGASTSIAILSSLVQIIIFYRLHSHSIIYNNISITVIIIIIIIIIYPIFHLFFTIDIYNLSYFAIIIVIVIVIVIIIVIIFSYYSGSATSNGLQFNTSYSYNAFRHQRRRNNYTSTYNTVYLRSSAIVGIVAAFFFFAGRRSNRCSSIHNVAPNLGSFRTKLDKCWRKNSNQNVHSRHATAAPAEFGTAAEVREVSLPPERPINNEPYFYHPVTVASSLARELDGSSVISYK